MLLIFYLLIYHEPQCSESFYIQGLPEAFTFESNANVMHFLEIFPSFSFFFYSFSSPCFYILFLVIFYRSTILVKFLV